MKSVLIIGAGQFGTHIAKRMTKLHCEVMAVDREELRINAILPLRRSATAPMQNLCVHSAFRIMTSVL